MSILGSYRVEFLERMAESAEKITDKIEDFYQLLEQELDAYRERENEDKFEETKRVMGYLEDAIDYLYNAVEEINKVKEY